ncbi:PREDICTED: uncharacterized protein LOC109159838 [Ipomoea nil]|uniref:uncharacterized protein LOC109159838 n=1 Tax=Ipomoea nil TaxID=35883 RepID=UPI0009017005|nr:PREDICTED: uncharacterized protein LOC109159838 [Ipomoea nil]
MDVQAIVASTVDIRLEDEEQGVRFEEEVFGGTVQIAERRTWSLVGRFLTDRNLKVDVMKRVMASAWRPLMGIEIADVLPNLYLFTFFDEADMRRVVDEGPWAFENATFLCHELKAGEDPTQVVLNTVEFWLQVYDIPPGFRTVKVLERIGDFAGVFLRYDERNFQRHCTAFYRVRITHDVSTPLKRRMKMILRDGTWTWINFRYERLHMFCFFCGIMGHTDKFCLAARRSLLTPEQFPFGPSLRAGGNSPAKVLGEKWFKLGQERMREIGFGDGGFGQCGTAVVAARGRAARMGVGGQNDTGEGGGGQPGPANLNEYPILELPWLGQSTDSSRGGGPCVEEEARVCVFDGDDGRGDHAERLRVKLGFEGCFKVDSVRRKGGLCLLWRRNNCARLLNYSQNHIDLEVSLPNGRPWRLTCFYGYPNRDRRRASWDFLRSLKGASDLPWVVLGDFNDILMQSEKRGRLPHPNGLLEGFGDALDDCGLMTLPMVGYPFTWERFKGTVDWVEERSDRVVTCADWRELFDRARVFNLQTDLSDHSALFLDIYGVAPSIRPRGFKFENAWLLDDGCRAVVEDEWSVSAGMGLQARLESCGRGLRRWGGERHHRFGKRIEEIRREMGTLRGKFDSGSLARFRLLDGTLSSVLAQEEAFWKQRAKQHWLQGADLDTKFFHKYASHRRRKNGIVKLKDEGGAWHEGQALSTLIADYYKNVFTSGGSPGPFNVDTLHARVTPQQNDDLLRPFQPDEVRAALFAMGKDKSPGPDGMNPGFYQSFWNVVGKDFTDFVIDCLSRASFPLALNDANIVLIPKKCNPESVSDLRPIALCNILYKIMAKMLANRMKPLLEGLISDSQSAFLPSRLISDNILIASEVGHYLRRKQLGQVGWATLKLDMAKAYDRMEWPFVRQMLLGLGFDERWVQLVMLCVQTVRYRVLVNGSPTDEILPTRGLRQGDPLSLYLFIICAEGYLCYYRILMLKALFMAESLKVKRCLGHYEAYSGQAVNFNKSSVSFSRNTSGDNRDLVAETLGVSHAEDFGKYLGLPSVIGRNRKVVFAYIEQKLKQRFGSWNKRLLSRAGKEVLLKSVAQAMPTYTMSIFLLPLTLCYSLERLMNRYWWGRNDREDGIHWYAWDRMCKPKKYDGMGFKRLHQFNLALLGKQGWRLLTCPDSLVARVFKARYYPTTSFFDAVIGGNPSYVWRSIMASQELVKSGCKRRIGNGKSTHVWSHPWLPGTQGTLVLASQTGLIQNMLVSDLIDVDLCSWNIPYVQQLFDPHVASQIVQLPVNLMHDDLWYWEGDLRGCYSVKDGYKRLGEVHAQGSVVWNGIWRLNIPPKWKNLMWRALSNILPTLDNLIKRRVDLMNICPACGLLEESIMHIFCTCDYASRVWIASQLPKPQINGSDFMQWAELWLDGAAGYSRETQGMICGLIHELWMARNSAVWEAKLPTPQVLCRVFAARWAAWSDCVAGNAARQPRQSQTASSQGITCCVDAGFHGPEHAPAFGFIVRENGVFVATVNGPMVCPYNPLMAETMAVCEALSWLKDNGYSMVKVYSDSSVFVSCLSSNRSFRSYVGFSLLSCIRLLSSMPGSQISFISRVANQAAHTLAKHVSVSLSRSTWRDVSPPFILPDMANEI